MELGNFFSKLKEYCLEQWKNMNTAKRIKTILTPLLVLVLIICFFATDLSARVFNAKEYKAYEYAIECVEKELSYPNTADFPSFKETTIKKSVYGTRIILDQYSTTGSNGKTMKYAWDISGYFTYENKAGMTCNGAFSITVVLSDSGTLWCYRCDID